MSAADPRPGVFDEHLARHYDQTRGLTQVAMDGVVRLLRQELMRSQPCLEIGIGTGRMALPLAAAGIDMVGVDASLPMLQRLIEKSAGAGQLVALRGDATDLPFADGSFGSGLICHVLHLIPDWERALAELARVVRRPGVILSDLASSEDSGPWRQLRLHFHERAGVIAYSAFGVRDGSQVDEVMGGLGATVRELPAIVDTRTTSAGDLIDRLEMGIHSSNNSLPAEARRRSAEETRSWARHRFGDLGAPIRQEQVLRWRAYDLAS